VLLATQLRLQGFRSEAALGAQLEDRVPHAGRDPGGVAAARPPAARRETCRTASKVPPPPLPVGRRRSRELTRHPGLLMGCWVSGHDPEGLEDGVSRHHQGLVTTLHSEARQRRKSTVKLSNLGQ